MRIMTSALAFATLMISAAAFADQAPFEIGMRGICEEQVLQSALDTHAASDTMVTAIQLIGAGPEVEAYQISTALISDPTITSYERINVYLNSCTTVNADGYGY